MRNYINTYTSKMNAPAILHASTKSLVSYNRTDLGHYLVAETVVENNVDGVLDEAGYVDPWYKDYGKESVFGKHFDSASNVFKVVNGRYIIWGAK